MRIALRFSVVFFAVLFVVLAGQATWSIRADWLAHRRDLHRDHRLTGEALAEALALVWSENGADAAERLLSRLSLPKVQLKLKRRRPREGRALPPEEVRQRLRDDELITRVPLRITEPDGTQVWLELVQFVPKPTAFVERTLLPAAFTSILTATLFALMGWLLGVRLIARPVALLVRKTQRIRDGDLGNDLNLGTGDELQTLAEELNTMCARLQEADLRVGEAQAARSLAEAARDEAVDQLRHADRLATVGKLAASVAHELGTPLSIVVGRAQMIQRGRVAPEQTREVAGIIAAEGQRVTEMIRELLDFSRRQPPQTTTFDLSAQSRAWLEVLEPLAKREGVVVRGALDQETFIEADPALVQQVFTNLLVNAVHALPEGGTVDISVTEGSPEGEPGPWWRLSVEDGGVGMSDEVKRRLFEPFFTTKPEGKGTGIGLSVVKDVLETLDGRIEVESEEGQGSRFSVFLRQAERP